MNCEKTGAIAYSEEYGEFYTCDAFLLGNVYVFRVAGISLTNNRGDIIHYTIHQINHQFDRTGPNQYATFIATNVTYHGYEGKQGPK